MKPPSTGSLSAPVLQLPEHAPPAKHTRQLQHHRKLSGGFYCDAPPWKVDSGTSPVLPSRHRSLSATLWAGLNPCYELRPELTEHKTELAKIDLEGPSMDEHKYPKDKFTRYTENLFQVGNQQIMRKGGGTMAKTKDRE